MEVSRRVKMLCSLTISMKQIDETKVFLNMDNKKAIQVYQKCWYDLAHMLNTVFLANTAFLASIHYRQVMST